MSLVSGIAVEIAAKMGRLKSDLDKAASHVASFAKQSSDTIQRAFSSAGSAISTIFKKAFDQFGDAKNRMTELSSRSLYLQTSIAEIQAMDYAIESLGGSSATLDVALRHMGKSISLAVSGAGPAVKTLKELGLSARVLAEMSASDQLTAISNAIKQMGDQAKMTGQSYTIFREHILKTLGILGEANALENAKSQFRGLGVEITEADAKIIKMSIAAQTKFEAIKDGFFNKVTIPLLDAVGRIMTKFNDMITSSGSIESWASKVSDGILKILSTIESAFGNIEAGFHKIMKLKAQATLGSLRADSPIKKGAAYLSESHQYGQKFRENKAAGMSDVDARAAAQKFIDDVGGATEVINYELREAAAAVEHHTKAEAEALKKKGFFATMESDKSAALAKAKSAEGIATTQAVGAVNRHTAIYQASQHAIQLAAQDTEKGLKEFNKEALKAAQRASEMYAKSDVKGLEKGDDIGQQLKSSLEADKKRREALQVDPDEKFNKLTTEIHNSIKEGNSSNAQLLLGKMQELINQNKTTREAFGDPEGVHGWRNKKQDTTKLDAIHTDLQKMLTNVNEHQKISVAIDLTPEALKYLRAGEANYNDKPAPGWHSSDETIAALTAAARSAAS